MIIDDDLMTEAMQTLDDGVESLRAALMSSRVDDVESALLEFETALEQFQFIAEDSDPDPPAAKTKAKKTKTPKRRSRNAGASATIQKLPATKG